MSDENTQEKNGSRSFEERILMRLDSIDARLTALEERAERQQVETKPIWERALSEIAETRQEMHTRFDDLERKIDVLNRDLLQVRADHSRVERRLDKLETH